MKTDLTKTSGPSPGEWAPLRDDTLPRYTKQHGKPLTPKQAKVRKGKDSALGQWHAEQRTKKLAELKAEILPKLTEATALLEALRERHPDARLRFTLPNPKRLDEMIEARYPSGEYKYPLAGLLQTLRAYADNVLDRLRNTVLCDECGELHDMQLSSSDQEQCGQSPVTTDYDRLAATLVRRRRRNLAAAGRTDSDRKNGIYPFESVRSIEDFVMWLKRLAHRRGTTEQEKRDIYAFTVEQVRVYRALIDENVKKARLWLKGWKSGDTIDELEFIENLSGSHTLSRQTFPLTVVEGFLPEMPKAYFGDEPYDVSIRMSGGSAERRKNKRELNHTIEDMEESLMTPKQITKQEQKDAKAARTFADRFLKAAHRHVVQHVVTVNGHLVQQ